MGSEIIEINEEHIPREFRIKKKGRIERYRDHRDLESSNTAYMQRQTTTYDATYAHKIVEMDMINYYSS